MPFREEVRQGFVRCVPVFAQLLSKINIDRRMTL